MSIEELIAAVIELKFKMGLLHVADATDPELVFMLNALLHLQDSLILELVKERNGTADYERKAA